MDILQTITEEFNLTLTHAKNILSLIDEGNTIPFIARYRKEMTGSCESCSTDSPTFGDLKSANRRFPPPLRNREN